MIEGIQRFVGELRRAGVSVSPAESIDAARAVERLGIADRRRFRQALLCTLVKRAGERAIFDRLFERFFAPPVRSGRRPGRAGAGAAAAGGRPADEPPESGAIARGARGQSVPAGPPPVAPPAQRRSGERRLAREQARRWLADSRNAAGRPRGRIRRVRTTGDRPLSESRPGASSRSDPERRDLSGRIDLAEEREIAAQVPRMIEQIRLRAARRTRRAARGAPNIRSLFRENVRYGGIPFVLPRRRRRSRRARVVLLVDVSWSTARAAGLFLAMAGEFLDRAADTRVLLFVDRFVDATRRVRGWLVGGAADDEVAQAFGRAARRSRVEPGDGLRIGGRSFADLLGSLPELNLGAPSDYGRAFDRLSRARRMPAGRQTVLVVLGDGRTNVYDPQVWAFEEIAARAGAVLWLVPERIERWGTGDSALDRYLPHVDVAVEARDLRGLAAGLAELVRRL